MPQAELLKFLFVILVFSHIVAAQNFSDLNRKIRAAVENKDYKLAIEELETLRKSDEKIFVLNNYDYLVARLEEKSGDFAAAAANYQAVAARNSILSEYAVFHLSQIARASGNLMLERIFLGEILTAASPQSLLQNAAKTRLAQSYFESKNFAAVIQILNNRQNAGAQEGQKNKAQTTVKEQRPKTENRKDLLLLAESLLQIGKPNAAREIFTQLTGNSPNPSQPDDFALAAAKRLDELDGGKEKFGKEAPQLTDAEHYKRGSIYQFNRDFPLARLHFKAINEKFPKSEFAAGSLYQTGRSLAQENQFDEAINFFERLQAEFPDASLAKDALSQTASAFSRVNKPKEAINRYQKFIEKYPNAENLDRAYLNIVDISRDTGETQTALKWTAKTQEVFRGKTAEAVALFAQARIHISQDDWTNAIADLNVLQNLPDLGGTRVPGGTNRAEVAFLKAFALENAKRFEEAIDVYLSIPDGRNEYYGWQATERLKALANDDKTKPFATKKLSELTADIENKPPDAQRKSAQAVLRLNDTAAIRPKMLEILKKAYANLPEYQKIPNGKLVELGRKRILENKRDFSENARQVLADEFLFLGLYDEAAPELEEHLRTSEKNKGQKTKDEKQPDLAYTLAVFYNRGDLSSRAISYVEPLWKNVPADYEIELAPREQLEMLYPAPFADSLLRFAPERQVDPRFLLAIMRQESRFRPDVKSNAAARGLMQFISTTGRQIADELEKENFNQDELYNPSTAILFGSKYLSNLFKKFPRQPAAVAASYNGGEENMARWLARAKTDDPSRYVPEIIYSQSKDYVYKVMSNYRVYQKLYDEELRIKN